MEVGSLVGELGYQQAGVVQFPAATHAVAKIACSKACYLLKEVVGCQGDPLRHRVREHFCCQIQSVEDIHKIPSI